jgi:hypothetical protein
MLRVCHRCEAILVVIVEEAMAVATATLLGNDQGNTDNFIAR